MRARRYEDSQKSYHLFSYLPCWEGTFLTDMNPSAPTDMEKMFDTALNKEIKLLKFIWIDKRTNTNLLIIREFSFITLKTVDKYNIRIGKHSKYMHKFLGMVQTHNIFGKVWGTF